jgi:thioredoxin 1
MATRLMKKFQMREQSMKNKIEVLYIGASFCGPCRMFKPLVEQFFKENSDKFDGTFLDIEDKDAQQFNIKAVPTIVFLKDGAEQARLTGAKSKKMLEQALEDVTF